MAATGTAGADKITQEAHTAAIAFGNVFANNFDAAGVQLPKVAGESIQGAFADAFFAFIQAFMTQEVDAMAAGKEKLQAVRARATAFDKRKEVSKAAADDTEKLVYQVVEAEASILSALLMFLEPTWSDALSGAMLLRSAYNTFSALAKTAGVSHEAVMGLGGALPPLEEATLTAYLTAAGVPVPSPAGAAAPPQPPAEGTPAPPTPTPSTPAFPQTLPAAELEGAVPGAHAVVVGGIAFGTGVFNLLLSLLPPSRKSVAEWLGFSGDRAYGLAALRLAVGTGNMNAVFGVFLLLAYHTSLAIFHTRGDGAGLAEAGGVLQRCLALYPASAIFQWYHGRWLRATGAVHEAAAAYRRAYAAQSSWTALCALAEYELAWCALLQVDFPAARVLFARLAENSSWSKAFCVYCAGAAAAASGDHAAARGLFGQVGGLVTVKGGRTPPFEEWAQARAGRYEEAWALLEDTIPPPPTPTPPPTLEEVLAGGGAGALPPALAAVGHITSVTAVLLAGGDTSTVPFVGGGEGGEAPPTPPPIAISSHDFLLMPPALELAYLWNCFSTSIPLATYTLQWTRAWMDARAGKVATLYAPSHRSGTAGKGGFLGFGRTDPVSAFSDEDMAAVSLFRASAFQVTRNTASMRSALGTVQGLADDGLITPLSHGFWGTAFAQFETGLACVLEGDDAAATAAFEAVQTEVGKGDVIFGNRLSFRARQMELDLGEGKQVLPPSVASHPPPGAAQA